MGRRPARVQAGGGALEQVLWWAISRLNDEVEEREEERERKWAISLQPTLTQESRNLVRQISGPCINGGELNHYTNGLKNEL